MRIVKELLGYENWSAKEIGRLTEGRFSTSGLETKLANFDPDIKSAFLRDVSVIKKFAGEDDIEAERKGKDEFGFKPITKLWFSSNFYVKTGDRSYGAARKWHYFGFDKRFSETDSEDSNLVDKLTVAEEMQGLLRWSWEFYNLLDEQGFVETERSADIKKETQENSDHVAKFANDFFVGEKGETVLRDPAYSAFLTYLEAIRFRGNITQKDFKDGVYRALQSIVDPNEKTTDPSKGNRRVFRDVKFDIGAFDQFLTDYGKELFTVDM